MSITYIGHFKSYSMAYNLKDVFFLGFEHEYAASTYGLFKEPTYAGPKLLLVLLPSRGMRMQ